MSKHTPLPWEVRKVDGTGICDIWCFRWGKNRPAIHIAEAGNRADADYIARAANSHEDLIEALRDMVHRFAPSEYGLSGAEIACVARATQTIDKAEGTNRR